MTAATFSTWQAWALLSAMFAALTAIFAKVGVQDINSDLATFIRTIVVLLSLALILFATGQFKQPGEPELPCIRPDKRNQGEQHDTHQRPANRHVGMYPPF